MHQFVLSLSLSLSLSLREKHKEGASECGDSCSMDELAHDAVLVTTIEGEGDGEGWNNNRGRGRALRE